MAFTVKDMHDLTRLLTTHPEWLSEVRRIVLTQELLALPDLVRELAQAQTRTEARLDTLAARVEELAQAQVRTEARLDALAARVEELAQAQARTEARLDALAARVEELAQAQVRTEARLDALAARVDALAARVEELTQAQFHLEKQLSELAAAQLRTEQAVADLARSQKEMERRLNEVIGDNIARRYREHAGAYFGKWLKSIRVVSPNDLREDLEQRLTEAEVDDLMLTDVLINGRLRHREGMPEIWLVIEASYTIDRNDVRRAEERAGLMRRAGYRAMPVVAGKQILEGYEGAVEYSQVAAFLDGRRLYWDRAVEAAFADKPQE
jgi:predicted transcriptional regulator